MESEEINDEVLDAIGEVTNMICGKVKTDLVKSGMAEFNISVPTIVIGQNFMTYVRGVNAKSVVYPFFNEDGSQTINVEVKLEVK